MDERKDVRLPHEFIDTRHVPASSKLAEEMAKGEFVVTSDITSPRSAESLPRFEKIMQKIDGQNFQQRCLDWAFQIVEDVIEAGAAGIHAMNFGMPADLIDEFLRQIRDRAREACSRSKL